MVRLISQNRAKHTLACLGIGAVLALVPHLLGTSWRVITGLWILISFGVAVMGPSTRCLFATPVVLSAASVGLFVVTRWVGRFELDGTSLTISLLTVIIATCAVGKVTSIFGSTVRTRDVDAMWLAVPVVVMLGILNSSARSWTSEQGFGILASNGEDNAAWLLALSHSVSQGHTVLTQESSSAGGPSTGIFVAFWREIMGWLDPSFIGVNADNGLVLARFYPLIATLAAIQVFAVALRVVSCDSRLVRMFSTTTACLFTYSMFMGLATVGHFSAAVAGLFLVNAMSIAMIAAPESRTGHLLADSLVLVSLLAAGQAWFPLTFLAVLFVSLRIGHLVKGSSLASRRSNRGRELAVVSGSILVLVVVVRGLFSDTLSHFMDVDYIKRNLTLAGAYSTVSPWIALAGLVIPVTLVAPHWGNKNDARRSIAVLTLVTPPVTLFVLSYFLSPYTPQYGAWKYLYLAVAAVGPLAIVCVVNEAARSIGRRGAFGAVAASAVMLMLFPPPLTYANWSGTVGKTRHEWVDSIVRELRNEPRRPVGCLNTLKDDQTQNYNAYLCSRMAFGLGGFNEIHHRVWTAANLCAAPPEQVQAEWSVDRQRNLTVVLFNGTRTRSGVGCQTGSKPFERGWLTSIDLQLTRNLDIRGNPASPTG